MNDATQTETMQSEKKNTALAGILFIIGTISGILSYIVTGPILNGSAFLEKISGNENLIILGSLLVLCMGLSLAMVPVVLYPILRKHSQTLAMGYVVFRGGLETVTYLIIVLSWLITIPLSHAYNTAGTQEASTLLATGKLLLETVNIGAALTAIVFPLGAIMLYVALYQTRLIPRWLSIWGLAAVIIHLITTGVGGLLPLSPALSTIRDILNAPILVQEMVMAIWFIVKGFNSSSAVSVTARLAVSNH
jgi:hypothetical protein